MTGYIIGITLGSMSVSVFIYFFIKDLWKKKSLRTLVKDIGRTAEEKINSDISIWAKHTNNKFIKSSIYKYANNMVFEADSVLITKQAIIVIEIKSIKGKVIGSANDDHWKKVTENSEYNITNAIKQNDKHIKHIVNMTNFKLPIISLIIFSNRTSLVEIQDIPLHALITKHVELYSTLDKIAGSLPSRLTDIEVKNVYKTISSFKTNKKEDIFLHKRITEGGSQWK